jgi:hypothetical protein
MEHAVVCSIFVFLIFCSNFAPLSLKERRETGGRKMASIRKRGDLQWEARIRRKGYPVTCKTFNTKADAEKWSWDVEGEMDRGIFVSRVEAENTTLKEALERFVDEYVPHYKHPEVPRYTAGGLMRRKISSKFLAAIRTKDIAEYIQERENEGMSGNTIRLGYVNTILMPQQ